MRGCQTNAERLTCQFETRRTDRLVGQAGVLDTEIVIDCEPTYTPVRGRFWVTDRILRGNRNYPEI